MDSQGYVAYWEKIGEVDFGDGLVLPLHINFNSKRDNGIPSPYLGQGWLLPLLESKFIQEGEDRFVMVQPDGVNNLFLRATPHGSTLNGSAGWKGEIDGDIITAWAPCGWKIKFAQGRIVSMTTPKGRRLDWIYEKGRVLEVREGNTTRIKIACDVDGHTQVLNLETGQCILITQDKKPRIQTIMNHNVLAGVDNTLSSIVFADGRRQRFVFGANDKVQPTLDVGRICTGVGEDDVAATRRITWDAKTKLAMRDGEWVYSITQNSPQNNASISRVDAKGRKQSWFFDQNNGTELTENLDGEVRITSWFLSPPLAGKTRQIKLIKGNKTIILKNAYDEQGRLIRQDTREGTNRYVYDDEEKKVSFYENEKLVWTRKHDASGNVSEETWPEVKTIVNLYQADGGREERVRLADGSHYTIMHSKTKDGDVSTLKEMSYAGETIEKLSWKLAGSPK